MNAPVRVGIVGANASRGWALDAHIPALKRLPEFALVAVSARSQELADEAGAAFGAQRAFGDSLKMVREACIDLVVVTVKVPEHRAVVLAALDAGKHVYCEWPLGRDAAEAEVMATAVKPASHVMVGLQGLSAGPLRQAIDLVHQGRFGKLRVLRAFSPTAGWSDETPPHYAYLQDKRNGATLATIGGGHTLAAVEALAGPYAEIDARDSILFDKVRVARTQEIVERTCADHMMVLGKHQSGCVSTMEVTGGSPSAPFRLELVGENGWLTITGMKRGGYQQVGGLILETSFFSEPSQKATHPDLPGPAVNVAEAYLRFGADIRSGARTVPNFDDAVRLTRLLEKIDFASETGERQYMRSMSHGYTTRLAMPNGLTALAGSSPLPG
jgi:predicted dehydrogenase